MTNGLDIAFSKGTTDEGGDTAKVWNLFDGVAVPAPPFRSLIKKAVFSNPSVAGKVMTVNSRGSGKAARKVLIDTVCFTPGVLCSGIIYR